MKRYIKANTENPVLDSVTVDWQELEDGSGIEFIIADDDGDVLFEELFAYEDVDTDAIYASAVEMAIIALSQKYQLSENAIQVIKGE